MSNFAKTTGRLAVAVFAAMSLNACVDYSGVPYDPGYRTPPPSVNYGYRSRAPYYGGPRPYYRDSGYYRDSHRYHGGYHRYHGGYHRSHNDDQIKLTGGSQRGKPNRPEGYHSREWYEKRGYDLDQYKHQHRDSGRTHVGEDYRKKSSSSSKKKKKKK